MAASPSDTPIEALAERLVPGTRLAGLDLGTKTIGVALSDLSLRFATPHHVVRRTKFGVDAAALQAIFAREKVGGVVLGLPINMNGTEGPRAQATRGFVRNFAPMTGLPIVLWDERMSTVAAERAMIEADMSRKKRAEKIDAVAASIILQGALDRLANLGFRA